MTTLTIVTLSVIGVYLIITLVLGVIGWRRLQVNVEDFYVVSRSLGIFVLFLSISATYHSAFAVLTSTAVAVTQGVAWFVGAMSWTVLAGICFWIFGMRYWHLGRKFGYITMADLIADFYQSNVLRGIVGVVMAVFTIPYITVQAVAFGLFLEIGSDGFISYNVGAFILTAVAVLYCIAAGQRAVSWTDVLQGVWMFVAVWVVSLVVVFSAMGGIGNLFAEVNRIAPELLRVPGEGWSHPLALFSSLFLFSLGLMVTQQHIQMKFYSAMDVPTIKWSGVGTAIYLSAIYIPPVLTGLTVYVLIQRGDMPPINEIVEAYGTADAVLALVTSQYAPALLVGILFAGAIAAATSSKDNFLLATSVVLCRDIYQKLFKPNAGDREIIFLSRVVIVIFGFLGWYLAVLRPGLIFDIVAVAVAGTMQFIPAVVAVTFPTRKIWLTAAGAASGIVVGIVLLVLLFFRANIGWEINLHNLHPGMWALFANIIVGVIVSLFTAKPPQEAVDRIHGHLEEAIYKKNKL